MLLGISSVLLLGYLHKTPLLYGATIIPVALPTATAFFLLACSIIVDAGTERWPFRAFVGNSAKASVVSPRGISSRNGYGALLRDGTAGVAAKSLWFRQSQPWCSSSPSRRSSRKSPESSVAGSRPKTKRNLAQKTLETLNENLEKTVEDRTQELRLKNVQMEEELLMARELQFAMPPAKRFPSVPENAEAKRVCWDSSPFIFRPARSAATSSTSSRCRTPAWAC